MSQGLAESTEIGLDYIDRKVGENRLRNGVVGNWQYSMSGIEHAEYSFSKENGCQRIGELLKVCQNRGAL